MTEETEMIEEPLASPAEPLAAEEPRAAPEAKSPASEAETSAPEAKSPAPEAKSPAPEAESPAPEAETSAPEAETPAPEAETSAPEAETSAPEAEAPAPAEAPASSQPAEPAAPITVGRMVADALRRAGVRWAFTVPGESFLGLLDGLHDAGINVVATRHEGAAAFMAEAHAQLTGRPAVALGTRAVGAANLAIGIHTAHADSSPMFVLIGQVPAGQRGREGFQEIDLVGSIGRLAKWAVEPADVESAVEAVREAVTQATTGRPGPVLLSFPEDLPEQVVAQAGSPAEPRATAERATPDRVTPDRATDDEIREVLQLLARARRPVILAGAGILRARTSNDLVRLAELLRVPVIAAWRRGDVISNDHPLYLGMAGYGAPPTVRSRLESADAMLVIGSRLNEITSYDWSIPGPATRWAHVDIEPIRPAAELPAADLAVRSDARLFLRAAVSRLEARGVLDAVGADARTALNAEDRAAWEAATIVDSHPWSGPGVHPGRVVATLRRLLPDDAIVATDAGSFGTWAARGFRFRRPGTFLGATSGAMGYGLPAAIAAGLVHRDRVAVALVGDGGLGMTLAEIETAVRMGLRTIVVVFDNQRFGMIRTYQDRREGGSTVGTELGPVDFGAAARALGARGVGVTEDAAFEPALRSALVSDRPTVLHLTVDPRWENVDSRP